MFPGQHGRRLRRRPACPAIGQRAADALGPPWIGRYVYTHLSLSLSIYIYIYQFQEHGERGGFAARN